MKNVREHGEWIYYPNGTDFGIGAWMCSLCGCRNLNLGTHADIKPMLFSGSRFCPHCGAIMGMRKEGTK